MLLDAAKILDVIAGYDPKDEMTVLSIGRAPAKPYAGFAATRRLDNMRIGVVREYMSRELFSKADEQSIQLLERAIDDVRKLGATVVDPGPEGALFQACIVRYAPELLNSAFARQYPQLFAVNPAGQPATDHIARLLDLRGDPAKAPQNLSLRNLGGGAAAGEGKYMINRYLQRSFLLCLWSYEVPILGEGSGVVRSGLKTIIAYGRRRYT